MCRSSLTLCAPRPAQILVGLQSVAILDATVTNTLTRSSLLIMEALIATTKACTAVRLVPN